MKKINLVFGVLLAASLCGNVYLWGAQQEQAGQLAEGNARLEELQQQSADRQAGQADLTAQIDTAQRNLKTAQQDTEAAREALQIAAIPEQKPAPATESPAVNQNGAVSEQDVNDLLTQVLGDRKTSNPNPSVEESSGSGIPGGGYRPGSLGDTSGILGNTMGDEALELFK